MKRYLMQRSHGGCVEFRIALEEDKEFESEVREFEVVAEFEDEVNFVIGTTNVMWGEDNENEYEEDYSENGERDIYVRKEDAHAFISCVTGGCAWDYGESQNMDGSYDSSVVVMREV